MSEENNIETQLERVCPCRQKQINEILKLFGRNKKEMSVQSILLYGNTASGKTHTMKKIMGCMNSHHSFVSCVENFTSKQVYQKILRDADCPVEKSCLAMMDFCRYLKMCPLTDTFFIILDKAERLRNMEFHLLPSFLRLAELTDLNICVIFISELNFEKFMTTGGLYEPYKIHFGDYSKAELKTLMSLDCPHDCGVDFYASYCSVVVDVFYQITRDLNELRYLAIVNFTKYCEPIETGEIEKSDVRRLWMKVMPHLKKAMQTVYLREVSSVQWEKMRENSSLLSDKYPKAQVELPYYSKHLLLAAYFASYNPATSDRRFFAKRSFGKMSSRAKRTVKSAKNMDKKFLGPKPFQIDRLMAIFYSIVEGGASPSANILSQISSLVTLKLLVKCSADDQIDKPKYKCVIPLDLAVSVGKQVDMDVIQYLYDT